MAMYYVVEDGRIVNGTAVGCRQDYDHYVRYWLEDGQELVTAQGLENRQIYQYLDDVWYWDDRLVPELMTELCERLGLNEGDYEDCDQIFDAITEKMGLTS